jgi:hypothetical protein
MVVGLIIESWHDTPLKPLRYLSIQKNKEAAQTRTRAGGVVSMIICGKSPPGNARADSHKLLLEAQFLRRLDAP